MTLFVSAPDSSKPPSGELEALSPSLAPSMSPTSPAPSMEEFYDRRHSEFGPQKVRYFQNFAPWSRLRKTVRIIEGLGISKKRVLDIGCGDGSLLARLEGANKGTKLYGVDISDKILESARKNVPGATFKKSSAEKLDLPDSSFDISISTEVIEHVPQWENVIQEAARVTAPGGTVLISVPVASWYRIFKFRILGHKPYYMDEKEHLREYSLFPINGFVTIKELIHSMKSAGLDIAKTRGAYMLEGFPEARLNRMLKSKSASVKFFVALDRILGVVPGIKYLGRYVIIVSKKRGA